MLAAVGAKAELVVAAFLRRYPLLKKSNAAAPEYPIKSAVAWAMSRQPRVAIDSHVSTTYQTVDQLHAVRFRHVP